MVKGLYTAYTGMVNEMKRMDVMTNNLANADTTGYKKEGTTSHSFAEQLAVRINDTSNYGLPKKLGGIKQGVHLGETYTDWTGGSIEVTENPTDLAINGNGFFAVAFTNKDGETTVKYTRDGAFKLTNDGYLVTTDGDHVLNATGALNGDTGEGNWIRVNPTLDFEIDQLGIVRQNQQIVGTVGVVDFEDYDYISKYGENLYDLIPGGNVVASDATIEQGALETSNVQVVSEMVNMITIQRAYEAGQKVITAIDETLDKSVNEVGRVQ